MTKIQFRRGTASGNPVLAVGEPGFKQSTGELKIGDGVTPWNSLLALATIDVSPVGNGPFAGVLAHLNHNCSTVIQAIGDSTVLAGTFGDVDGGWFGRIGTALGDYFDANVWVRYWNDTNQSYDPPTVLRTSSHGARVVNATGVQYTAASVTGDLEVIAKVTPPGVWNAGTGNHAIVSKWVSQVGWGLLLDGGGAPYFAWNDGATVKVATSTATVPFAAATAGWVRLTFQVNNGAGGNTAKFYTSNDGITWAQLGSTVVTSGTTSIFDNSADPYQLGSVGGSSLADPWAGTISWVQVRNALANGRDMVPMLPEQWDMTSFFIPSLSGGPLVLLMNGGKSGASLTYYDDNTRRPKMLTAIYPDVIITGDGINDFLSNSQFAANYLTYVNNVKSYRPNVPIIVTTENPLTTGTATNPDDPVTLAARAARMATVMSAQPGVTVLDTAQAYTSLSTEIAADGVHPTPAGYAAQANWMLARLAPKTVA